MDVKKLREELGLTQKQFAELLGVNQSQISRWERQGYVPKRVEKCLQLLIKLREIQRLIQK